VAENELNVVTGAYSFTGKYIARRLLFGGKKVRTLTGHPRREHPFGDMVPASPFNFGDPAALVESLCGATTLYNTYWIRFELGRTTFEQAVANTETLLQAARKAGLRRFIHISAANADENSPFRYFRAKALAERAVRDSGLSWAILRPTILFGRESILFNNIAWLLRRFPVFAIPDSNQSELQPIYVDDVAELAIRAGEEEKNPCIDAGGPEVFAFDRLVRLMAETIGTRVRLLRVNPKRMLRFTRMLGGMVKDVLLTEDELEGLARNLLISPAEPAGHTPFGEWLTENASALGLGYFSEMERHFDQTGVTRG
jgi:NADH dehydrogenase